MTDGLRRREFLTGMSALALASPAVGARASTYPTRPIRMILPLSAGSTVDVVARLLAEPMSRALGQPIIIDNRPGAGGVNGTEQLVRAEADGHTIGMTSSNHVINPGVYPSLPFDSIADITPISVTCTVPLVLVAHPSLAARNVQELVALARARPDELNYGSAGNGTVLHLAGVLFTSEAGVRIDHVPYRGTGPLVNDLLAGHVQLGFLSGAVAAQHVRAGTMRALAVSTTERLAMLPDVPTLAESGLPNYSFDAWIALIGPARLPWPVVERLYAEVTKALADGRVRESLSSQGLSIVGTGPNGSAAFFRSELDKHLRLVRQSGAVAQ